MSREQNPIENQLYIAEDSDSDLSIESNAVEHPPIIVKSQRKRPNFQIWDEDSMEYKLIRLISLWSFGECFPQSDKRPGQKFASKF